MTVDHSAALERIEFGKEGWEADLIALFEVVRDEGGVAVIKFDGERDAFDVPFTAILSQGRLKSDYLRKDASNAHSAAAWCLLRYFDYHE